MTNATPLEIFVNECLAESKIDYIGLWQISQTIRERFGATTTIESRKWSLKVVKLLYEEGLRPGDYWGNKFYYWPDDGCRATLDRIEQEWIEAGADPNLGRPICWLAPRTG